MNKPSVSTKRKRAERLAQEDRLYAESIVATVREPLLVLTKDLRIKLANRSFYETFRVSPKETKGHLIYELGNGQWDIPELRMLLNEILTKNTPFQNFKVEHHFQTLGKKTMLLNARRLSRTADQTEMILLAIEDVTEHNRAGERLRIVFESAPNGMMMVNRQGKIVLVNSQAEKLFGYSRQELLGRTIGRLVPERFRNPHREYQDSFFADPSPRAMGAGRDLTGLKKDGTEIPTMEIGLSPIETAEGLFTLASIIDITERKKTEGEIKKLLQVKTDFTNMVSHELRTPLVAIRESNNIVYEGAAGPVNAEQKSYLEMVKRNVERLTRLIDGILDFSRLETGKKEFRMVEGSINDLIAEAVRFQKPVVSRKGLGIRCELDSRIPKIKFDPDGISQVLTNLVSNAEKFTEKGEIVIVSKLESKQIQVSVRDTGPGIEAGDIGRLFQPFEQAASKRGQKPEGTGLGLAISKQIIERHDGKISIESEVGKGTLVRFSLPL